MTGALGCYLEEALARSQAPLEGGDGVALTARSVLTQAQAIARGLPDVERGEPVLATISNAPMDLASMLGVWLAGGVVVPLEAGAAAATAERLQQATGARYRVAHDGVAALSSVRPPPRPLLREAALVIFTSGSTGQPKGVAIGHDRMAGKLDVLGRLVGLSPADHVAVPLRLTFIFGIWVSLLAVRSGSRLVLMPKFTPDAMARVLAGGATVLAAVPTMLRAMLAAGMPAAPRLRSILTGGETLGVALGANVRAALPHAGLADLYGLTETGSCDFCLPQAEQDIGAGSIGRTTEQVAFRLIGADGQAAGDGAAGELCIRTPFGMLGYLDDPALTAASFRDGYFRTGDLARLRADGRVEIVGRAKDIISRGGNKIAPAEIDALLSAHPQVAAALCAGVPDTRLGEAIHAIVVAKPGADLTADALRSWAAERIERYKVPDAIHFRNALPTGSTGKVRRAGVVEAAREPEAG